MSQSVEFTIKGAPVRVTPIQTGTITIKRCHHTCCLPERAPMTARFAAILADRRWADPLPIWTFMIEHPEGIFIVDAGATPDFNDDASWTHDPGAGKLLRSFLRIDVGERETLPAQIDALGIPAADVSAVVLTHQHIDHTASVPAFEHADTWTTEAEDRAAAQTGSCPWRWRWRTDQTRIRHIDNEGIEPAGATRGLRATVDLVADGSLRAIHTPGHTPGSVSVALATDQVEIWFTGDTSFTADTMNRRLQLLAYTPTCPQCGGFNDTSMVEACSCRRTTGTTPNVSRRQWRDGLELDRHNSRGERSVVGRAEQNGLE